MRKQWKGTGFRIHPKTNSNRIGKHIKDKIRKRAGDERGHRRKRIKERERGNGEVEGMAKTERLAVRREGRHW